MEAQKKARDGSGARATSKDAVEERQAANEERILTLEIYDAMQKAQELQKAAFEGEYA